MNTHDQTIIVSLISEQTIPNLLPLLYLKPTQALLIHTAAEYSSKRPAQRLRALLPSSIKVKMQEVDAYRIDKIQEKLLNLIPSNAPPIFNLTGGTKPMSLAAFQAARALRAQSIYYRTEGDRERGQQSVLYWYAFEQNGTLRFQKREPLPSLLTLDLYLKAYLGEYEPSPIDQKNVGLKLEKAVLEAINEGIKQGEFDEVQANIQPKGIKKQAEIDLLVRRGNNVAVLEVKSGGEGSEKKALDQLTTIAAREYLGTYARRVLVTLANRNARANWYQALARALRVEVIEIQHLVRDGHLHPQDKRNLIGRLRLILS